MGLASRGISWLAHCIGMLCRRIDVHDGWLLGVAGGGVVLATTATTVAAADVGLPSQCSERRQVPTSP